MEVIYEVFLKLPGNVLLGVILATEMIFPFAPRMKLTSSRLIAPLLPARPMVEHSSAVGPRAAPPQRDP